MLDNLETTLCPGMVKQAGMGTNFANVSKMGGNLEPDLACSETPARYMA